MRMKAKLPYTIARNRTRFRPQRYGAILVVVSAGAFTYGVPVGYSETDSATGKWKMAKVASDSIISSGSTVTKRGLPKTERLSLGLWRV